MGEIKERDNNPKIMEPDEPSGKGELPSDLWNAVNAVAFRLQLFKMGKYSEDKFKQYLRTAETFDDYYTKIAGRCSENEVENGREPFDVTASVAAQRAVIVNQETIARFDEKIIELRATAEAETIDTKKIEEIINEIKFIIYGERQ